MDVPLTVPAAILPGMGERQAILDQLSRLGRELAAPVTVCLVHRKFVPCRRLRECDWSSDPEDIAAVSEWQRGL